MSYRGMVPKGGLEPPRVTSHAPQTCASASSATSAYQIEALVLGRGLWFKGLGSLRETRNFRVTSAISSPMVSLRETASLLDWPQLPGSSMALQGSLLVMLQRQVMASVKG